jgi:hypothetical protein
VYQSLSATAVVICQHAAGQSTAHGSTKKKQKAHKKSKKKQKKAKKSKNHKPASKPASKHTPSNRRCPRLPTPHSHHCPCTAVHATQSVQQHARAW